MKISDLKESDYNPRKISDKQIDRLEKSMLEFGDLSGIVVNVRSGNMIGGHQRVKTLDPNLEIVKAPCEDRVGTVAIGYLDTPSGRWQYREVDWPQKKELAANLAANKHGGSWDKPKLENILIELDDGDFDLELTGFDSGDLKTSVDFDGGGEKEEDGKEVCQKCGAPL